jgi:hypothetical protein
MPRAIEQGTTIVPTAVIFTARPDCLTRADVDHQRLALFPASSRGLNSSKARIRRTSLHHWSGLNVIIGLALLATGIFYLAFAPELKGNITDLTVYTVAGTCGVFGGLLFASLAAFS